MWAEVYFTRDGALAATGRSVSGPGFARASLDAVLAGPNPAETDAGMTNGVPLGTRVLGLNIADGVATVDLSGEFEAPSGSLSMQLRAAQVVYTLTQFDTVDAVDIHIDGKAVDTLGGENQPANGLDRDSVRTVTPPILVTSPAPGSTVKPTFSVAGLANTFEATVGWSIVGPDDEVWASGAGTASAGNGTWGDFDFQVSAGDHAGPATLRLFQQDMESGGEDNAVETPVTIG